MAKKEEVKNLCENRKARHDYHIIETYEAGISLVGTEVKSLKNGVAQIRDTYVDFHNGEMFLINFHIPMYAAGGTWSNHDPDRRRKLLMKRSEIEKLYGQVREKGMTLIPLRFYVSKGYVKLELAVAKGKNTIDKRDTIKKRDVERTLQQSRRLKR